MVHERLSKAIGEFYKDAAKFIVAINDCTVALEEYNKRASKADFIVGMDGPELFVPDRSGPGVGPIIPA